MTNYIVAEGVSFKSPVYVEDQTKTFKQVEILGKVWRYFPTVAKRQDLVIMHIMVSILRNPNIPLFDRMAWVKNAKDFEKAILGKYHIILRKDRKEFSEKIWLMTLEAIGLNPTVALAYPDFIRFIKSNHLDKMIKNHGHSIQVFDGVPAIMFYGKYVKWSQILEKVKLDVKAKNGMDLKSIGWTYLGESDLCPGGLVHYSPSTWKYFDVDGKLLSTTPLPYGKLTLQEKEELKDSFGKPLALPFIQNFADCRAIGFPDNALENNDHCFTKLIDPAGNIWYFGYTCKETHSTWEEMRNALASNKAVVESPDRYADVPPVIRESEIIPCGIKEFEAEFNFFVKKHISGDVYNLVDNCVDAVYAANEAAGLSVPGDAVKIEFFKLFPKSLQIAYAWTPLPANWKRVFARKFLLSFIGFNSGETVNGQKISLRVMRFPVDRDLKVSHPRLVREEMIRRKQATLKNA